MRFWANRPDTADPDRSDTGIMVRGLSQRRSRYLRARTVVRLRLVCTSTILCGELYDNLSQENANMTSFLLGVGCGLVLGWLFIPMPQWVADVYAKLSSK